MSRQFFEVVVTATQTGVDWSVVANISTTLSGGVILIGLLAVVYRYATATPLEKLLMEGTDKILLQMLETFKRMLLIGYIWGGLYFLTFLMMEKPDDVVGSLHHHLVIISLVDIYLLDLILVILNIYKRDRRTKNRKPQDTDRQSKKKFDILFKCAGYVAESLYKSVIIMIETTLINYFIWYIIWKFKIGDLLKEVLLLNVLFFLCPCIYVLFVAETIGDPYRERVWRNITTRKAKMRLIDIERGGSLFVYELHGENAICGVNQDLHIQHSFKLISLEEVRTGKYVFKEIKNPPSKGWQNEPYEYWYKNENNIADEVTENNQVILIDVSEARRFKRSHPPKAVSFQELGDPKMCSLSDDLFVLKQKLMKKCFKLNGEKPIKILVYCSDENRLMIAAWRLIAMEYTNVYQCKKKL